MGESDFPVDTQKQMIEEACQAQGLTIDSWDVDKEDDRPRANLGRWQVVEDDEDEGLFTDDEGVLYASVVGHPKYRNTRVHFGLMADGTDVAVEVSDPLGMLVPVDEPF